jgi:hypothetical protein
LILIAFYYQTEYINGHLTFMNKVVAFLFYQKLLLNIN